MVADHGAIEGFQGSLSQLEGWVYEPASHHRRLPWALQKHVSGTALALVEWSAVRVVRPHVGLRHFCIAVRGSKEATAVESPRHKGVVGMNA